jgi:pullulanase/glycogen debranching enzyme
MFRFFISEQDLHSLQALNRIDLRIVLDVVYNHVHGSGPFDENSVLDKVMICY